ncbi:MAG: YifB family Mg chelatase-like AAA ATPase [Planctomycetes bacterium]|nr:YifB family Mg chelatase-like AAA ATPase [Planctomycetota bacterium]
MLAKTVSVSVYGIDAYMVEVEVDIARGLPAITVVGLPDAAVKESRDRVKAAVVNAGYRFPPTRLTINLAPADTKKEGPSFDLPIAVGVLAATQQLPGAKLRDYAIVGELALDGGIRPVRGCLPMALGCKAAGLKGMLLPAANAPEAAVVGGLDVLPVEKLPDAVGFLADKLPIEPHRVDFGEVFRQAAHYDVDFADVKSQEHVKRALTVAAAGDHNALMIGPPGAGKTMLAQRLPTILPHLGTEESLETTKIYSVAGLLPAKQALLATRPFRSPHHTISDAGLVGGGTYPRPGEVSLAHHGVLFLDELPEFNRKTLETLRQPLEDGRVTIARALGSVTFPSEIMLVAALNPCPCGYYTDPRKECHCTPTQIQNYLSRISGPLLDRIDIHVEVPSVHYQALRSPAASESSAQIRERVTAARERQRRRFAGDKVFTNARMTSKHIKKHCVLDDQAEQVLRQAMNELALSARAYTKILKVSRTIADLADSDAIRVEHVTEAIQYRSLDRNLWA